MGLTTDNNVIAATFGGGSDTVTSNELIVVVLRSLMISQYFVGTLPSSAEGTVIFCLIFLGSVDFYFFQKTRSITQGICRKVSTLREQDARRKATESMNRLLFQQRKGPLCLLQRHQFNI
jgi:hypothetical protein